MRTTAFAGSTAAPTLVRPAAGDGILHPFVLAGIALLVVNDHLLKSLAPGLLTGKLSDVGGLIFFPLFLVAVWEVVASRRGRWAGPSVRVVALAVAATGVAFALAKTTGLGETAYEVGLGLFQWPFGVLADLARGTAPRGPVPVDLVRDPTDLVALAALWLPFELGRRRAERVAAARVDPYDLGVAGLSVALLAGAILDGWAHSHEQLALESILTPWHAVVYGAYVALALVVLGPSALARLDGRSSRAAIPPGYGWSVVGVVGFAVMGLADTAWHAAFGIEVDAEALLSPTHIGLAVTGALIASGPVRVAWARHVDAAWPAFLAPLLALMVVTGLAAFALHVANLFVDPWPRFPYARTDATWYGPHVGVAAAIVQTVVIVVPMLLLVRRWPSPPAGAMTLLVGGSLGGLTLLHDQGALVGVPIVGGFLVDLALIGLRPVTGRRRTVVLGAVVPAALFVPYFVVLDATGPVAWSAHLIGGTVAVSAMVGGAVAALAASPVEPPARP